MAGLLCVLACYGEQPQLWWHGAQSGPTILTGHKIVYHVLQRTQDTIKHKETITQALKNRDLESTQ